METGLFQKSKFWDIIWKQYRSERHQCNFCDPVTQLGLTYTNDLFLLKTLIQFPFFCMLYYCIRNILSLWASIQHD